MPSARSRSNDLFSGEATHNLLIEKIVLFDDHIEKVQKKTPTEPFYGFCWVSLGEVDVNYPNTVFPVKDGFGFVIWLKNL